MSALGVAWSFSWGDAPSVTVYLLVATVGWVLWHGVMSNRRRANPRRRVYSIYLAELPFRVVATLALFALGWLTEPGLGTEVAEVQVSGNGSLHTLHVLWPLAVARALEGYLLLLIAHGFMRTSLARRLFQLRERSGERATTVVIAIAALAAGAIVGSDILLHQLQVLSERLHELDSAVPPVHPNVGRLIQLALALGAGMWAAGLMRQRERERMTAEYYATVIRSILEVNQLIARETSAEAVLQGACRTLVASQGYYNVWVAYTDPEGATSFYASGLGDDIEQLRRAYARTDALYCARQVTHHKGVVAISDPQVQCRSCPVATNYEGRGALAHALEYGPRTHGMLCASVPKHRLRDQLQHDLFEEVCNDLAFALSSMEHRELRRAAEQALRSSEQRFRLLYEDAPIAYQCLDAEGRIVTVNNAWLDATGYDRESVAGTDFSRFVVPEDRDSFVACFRELKETGVIREREYRLRRRDGATRVVSFEAKISRKRNGGYLQSHCVFFDVTERRRTEQALHESLREKEVLLQEVHHRVRNNLNIIISLINLRSSGLKSTHDAMHAFRDTENRIRALAMVHGQLYDSEEIGTILVAEYLRDISMQLLQQYDMTRRVTPRFSVLDVRVDLNTAVPLGLFVNEAVSNSLEHAFPTPREGELHLRLERLHSSQCRLLVLDDGIGISPASTESSPDALGVALMRMLADQMDAVMEVGQARNDPGTGDPGRGGDGEGTCVSLTLELDSCHQVQGHHDGGTQGAFGTSGQPPGWQ